MNSKIFSTYKRRGFTPVDVVITLALLSICVSLFLPAIQSLREAARNTVCEQRLADIAQETFDYHDIHCRLPVQIGPVGGVDFYDWTSPTSENFWGVQQSTSPVALGASTNTSFRIEPIFFNDQVRLEETRFTDNPSWNILSKRKLSRFRCPSDSALGDPEPTMGFLLQTVPVRFANGPDNDNMGVLYDSRPELDYGRNNYVGCLGATGGGFLKSFSAAWKWRGMLTSRELITLEYVTNADGLSNTVMYGENIGDVKTIGRKRVLERACLWLSGGVARGRGLTFFGFEGTTENPLLGRANRSAANGFGSNHREGVNFVYGDGSIHQLSRTIDRETYYQLCGAFDTE